MGGCYGWLGGQKGCHGEPVHLPPICTTSCTAPVPADSAVMGAGLQRWLPSRFPNSPFVWQFEIPTAA